MYCLERKYSSNACRSLMYIQSHTLLICYQRGRHWWTFLNGFFWPNTKTIKIENLTAPTQSLNIAILSKNILPFYPILQLDACNYVSPLDLWTLRGKTVSLILLAWPTLTQNTEYSLCTISCLLKDPQVLTTTSLRMLEATFLGSLRFAQHRGSSTV